MHKITVGYSAISRLAWCMHFVGQRVWALLFKEVIMLFLLLELAGSACIIPPSLQEASPDGGENHRPIVTEATVPPLRRDWTVMQNSSDIPELTVYLFDPDEQKLTTRVFLDRNYKEIIADIEAEPTASTPGLNYAKISIPGLCGDKVDFIAGRHFLEVYVSDNGFITTGPDLRLVKQGGGWDTVSWDLQCISGGGS
jgi:hypothetical protein